MTTTNEQAVDPTVKLRKTFREFAPVRSKYTISTTSPNFPSCYTRHAGFYFKIYTTHSFLLHCFIFSNKRRPGNQQSHRKINNLLESNNLCASIFFRRGCFL